MQYNYFKIGRLLKLVFALFTDILIYLIALQYCINNETLSSN